MSTQTGKAHNLTVILEHMLHSSLAGIDTAAVSYDCNTA